MDKPKVLRIKRHVDPMRYPKVQKGYEGGIQKAFKADELFMDIVKSMVSIVNEKE